MIKIKHEWQVYVFTLVWAAIFALCGAWLFAFLILLSGTIGPFFVFRILDIFASWDSDA